MRDTPRTDKAAFSLGFPCESEKVVQVDFARALERENAKLLADLKSENNRANIYSIVGLTGWLWIISLWLFGCTIGPETPAERKARKVLEPETTWQFDGGRWREVK